MPAPMNPSTAVDALVIDGAKLRQAREMRGLTVAELAALCTLSREQVQHIEDGGDRPFYTPAHKLLAIRKYAAAMGIPYDDVVTGPGADDTMPVPDDTPASLMVHGDGEEATDLRLAAVERNAEIRRKILIGAVTLTILLAFYAKMHGTPATSVSALPPAAETAATGAGATEARASSEAEAPPAPPAPATAPSAGTTPATRPEVTTAAAPVATPAAPQAAQRATPAATPQAAAGTTAAATAAVPSPAPKPAEAGGKQAGATASTTAAASAAGTATPPVTDAKLAASGEPCARPASGDVKTWTPTYQRKADTRLFLVSPKETTVCVHDASGKAALLTLKARTGQAYSGKPPYIVQSPQLSDIEIYLQGMRARVPAETPALRLQVSPVSSPDAG